MRRLVFIFLVIKLSLLPITGRAQETRVEEKPIIERVDISGVSESRISQELRDRMQELVGQRFDQLAADEVAFEIQNRLSERISAIRQFPGSDAEHIRVVFEVGGKIDFDEDRDENVNSRYIVEEVELHGVSESSISDELVVDMRRLVGQRLDQTRAEEILHRLRRELRPTRIVSKKVTRGNDRNHVRLIYQVERAPYFGFRKLGSYFVGQSKQSLSFAIEAPIEHHNNRFAFGVVNDGDKLIERDEGFRIAFENIRAGTQHLGFRIEYFDYNQVWRDATRQALASSPEVPGIFRERRGVEPELTIAIDPRFRFNIGASVTQLQMQFPQFHFQNANSGIATVTYKDDWQTFGGRDHYLTANYSIRAASQNLDSDFIYTRHFGEVRYRTAKHDTEFLASAMGGTVGAGAPLFERFVLGNTTTLRGWNKYDLDPIGGNRLAYGSLEFRYEVFQVFYDVGAVWDKGQSQDTSHAVGFGLHGRGDNSWFFTMGIPIRSGDVQPLKPLFMFGVHF